MPVDRPQTPNRRPDLRRSSLLEPEFQANSPTKFTRSPDTRYSHLLTPEGCNKASSTPLGSPPSATFDPLTELGKNRKTIRRGVHDAAIDHRANPASMPAQGSNTPEGSGYRRVIVSSRPDIASEHSTTPKEQPPSSAPYQAFWSPRPQPAPGPLHNRGNAANLTSHTPAETPNKSTTPFGSPAVTDGVTSNTPLKTQQAGLHANSTHNNVSQTSEVARFAMHDRHAKDSARQHNDSIDPSLAAHTPPSVSSQKTHILLEQGSHTNSAQETQLGGGSGAARLRELTEKITFRKRASPAKGIQFGTTVSDRKFGDRQLQATIYPEPTNPECIGQSEGSVAAPYEPFANTMNIIPPVQGHAEERPHPAAETFGPFGNTIRPGSDYIKQRDGLTAQPRRPHGTTIRPGPPKPDHIKQKGALEAKRREQVHIASGEHFPVRPNSRSPPVSELGPTEKPQDASPHKILCPERNILTQEDLNQAEAAWDGIKERYRAKLLKGEGRVSPPRTSPPHKDKQLPRTGDKSRKIRKRFSLTMPVIPPSKDDPDAKSILPLPELLDEKFDEIAALTKEAAGLSVEGGKANLKMNPVLEDVFRAPWPKGPRKLPSIVLPGILDHAPGTMVEGKPGHELVKRLPSKTALATSAVAIGTHVTGETPRNAVVAPTVPGQVPISSAQLPSSIPPPENTINHCTAANGYGPGWGFLPARKA